MIQTIQKWCFIREDGSSYYAYKNIYNHLSDELAEQLQSDVLMDGKVQERLLEDSIGYISKKDKVQNFKYYVCGYIN